jgi:hypothetical protein
MIKDDMPKNSIQAMVLISGGRMGYLEMEPEKIAEDLDIRNI